MKSSFLEKSKRALVLLLTGAMIATSVPSTAFAATVGDADDVIIEEVTDAVAEDAVVEEEVVAEPSDVVEALGAEEPVEGAADVVESDNAAYDKVITIGEAAAIGIGAPVVLTDLQYGAQHADVTVTAKQTSGGETSTFTGAKIELYSVNGADDTEVIANKEAVKTVVDAFNKAKNTYDADRTVAASKTSYDSAVTALAGVSSKLTKVGSSDDTAPASGTISNGLTFSIEDGVLTFSVPTAMHSVYDGWYVAKISDPNNAENLPIYTTVFEIKSIGLYNANLPITSSEDGTLGTKSGIASIFYGNGNGAVEFYNNTFNEEKTAVSEICGNDANDKYLLFAVKLGSDWIGGEYTVCGIDIFNYTDGVGDFTVNDGSITPGAGSVLNSVYQYCAMPDTAMKAHFSSADYDSDVIVLRPYIAKSTITVETSYSTFLSSSDKQYVGGSYVTIVDKTNGNVSLSYAGNDVKFVPTLTDADNDKIDDNTFNKVDIVSVGETPKLVGGTDNSLYFGTAGAALTEITFDEADMGYAVYNTKNAATDAGKVPGNDDNVVAQTLTIASDALAAKGSSSTVTDLTYTFTKQDGTVIADAPFEVSATPTNLITGTPVTLTIKPVEGLEAGVTTPGYAETYTAYLHISSATAFTDEYIIKLSFVVKNNLALSYKVGSNAKVDLPGSVLGILDTDTPGDNTKLNSVPTNTYAPGSETNPYIIATKKVGTSFDDIIITAKGGAGNTLTISTTGASATHLTADGLEGTMNSSEKTFVISGALKQSAYVDYSALLTASTSDSSKNAATIAAVKAHSFAVTAKDGNENDVTKYFIIVPDKVDSKNIEIKVGNQNAEYGADCASEAKNVYEWKAPFGTKNADVATVTRTISITNKTSVELKLANRTVTTSGGSLTGSYTWTPAYNAEIKIPAGETTEIVVAPTEGTGTNAIKNKIAVTGDAMATTTLELDFSIAASALEIITPKANNTIIPTGSVGLEYSGYQFESSTQAGATPTTWEITGIKYSEGASKFTGSVGATATETGATWTKVAADKLDETIAESGLSLSSSGLLSGTPAKAGYYMFEVKASTITTSSATDVTWNVYMEVVKPTVTDAVLVTSGETNLSTDKALTLTTTKVDASEGSAAEITIRNKTANDLEGVKATFTINSTSTVLNRTNSKSNITDGDVAGTYFKLVFDENDSSKNTYLATNGMKIAKNGGTATFKLVSIPGAAMIAGDYTVKVEINSATSFNGTTDKALVFTASLKVEDTPMLKANGKLAATLTAGATNDAAAATEYFSVVKGSDMSASTDDWNFAVADVTGSDMTIAESGLTFDTTSSNKKVGVSGTPKKAGTLKVSVTATSKKDTTVVTSKVFEINIVGTVTLTAKINGQVVGTQDTAVSSPVIDGTETNGYKVYVLPGLVEGGKASTTTLDISNAAGATVAGTGLTVTVDDAEDDRAGSVKETSDIANIYTGSKSVITVTPPANTTVAASGGTASAVINASAAKAGEYKVKVKVAGENIKPFAFYVYLIVSKPLELTTPANPVAEVGVKTHLEIAASGIDGNVSFTEVENAKGDALTSPSRITATGFGASSTANYVASKDTIYGGGKAYLNSFVISGTGLTADSNDTTHDNQYGSVLDSNNKVSGVAIRDYKDGAPTTQGTYAIYVKGSYAGSTMPTTGTTNIVGHYGADGTTIQPAANWINYNGTVPAAADENKPIAKQDKVATLNLTINKTSGVKIKNVTSDTNVANTAATKYDYTEGMTDADIAGIVSSEVRAYTIKSEAEGYASAPYIYVGIANTTNADISGATLTLNKTKFIPSTGNKTTSTSIADAAITGDGTTAKPYKITTLAAGKENYFKVTAASGLAKGTYEDTLTITSDNLAKPLTLKLTFVVAEKTYLIDAEYIADAGGVTPTALTVGTVATERGAGVVSYTKYKDAEKLTSIAASSVASGNKVELTPFIKGGSASNDDVLFLRNTGNTAIAANAVKIVEVDESGSAITSTSAFKLKTILGAYTPASTDEISIAAGMPTEITTTGSEDYKETYISIKPNNEATLEAGEYDAYLKVSIKNATPASFIVPVHFVVYDKDLTTISHTPTATAVTLASAAEGYSSDSITGGEFTVTNTATNAASTLYDLAITLSGTDAAAFKIVSEDENVDTTNSKIKSIASGASASFKVVPKDGLSAKTYKGAVTISGGNLAVASAIQKSLTFVVTESDSISVDVFSANAWDSSSSSAQYTALNAKGILPVIGVNADAKASFAQRLYNSFNSTKGKTYVCNNVATATGKATAPANVGTMTTITSGTFKVYVDLDENEVYDTVLTFTATGSTVGTITGVTVTRNTTVVGVNKKDISLPNASYTLSGFSYTDSTKYFKSVTFNQYSVVTIAAEKGKEFLNAKYADYEKDSKKVLIAGTVADNTNDGDLKGLITGTAANNALFAVVPNGSVAASSFTNGLPTVLYVDGSEAFEGWQTSGTRKTVDASTYVTADDTYVTVWHGHEYPGSTEGDTENIKWTWSADHKQATVTITCIKTCPDSAKGAITLDSTKGDILITDKKEEADCVKGERHEFTAATVASKMPNGAVYTSKVSTDEDPTTALGHQYSTTIAWEKQEDGNYKPAITQTCIRTGCEDKDSKKNYTVPATDIEVTEDVKKAASCTEAGQTVYTITSFKDGNGKTVTGTDLEAISGYTYNAVIDAKGHKWEVTECDLEAKTATFTCSVCSITHTGAVTITPSEDGNYTVTANDDNTITATYVDHEHVWKAGEWVWNPATGTPASAEITFTCSVGTKPETRKLSATAVAGTPDSEGNIEYTVDLTGPDGKAYHASKLFDKDGNEITHEHKWSTPSWSWANKDTATATFTCSVGKETKGVTATGTDITVAKGPNSKGNTQYKATVTGPDNQEYSDLKWFDASGNPTSGEGIGIELAETEYPYTGAKIIPVFTVVDYALDKVLAEKTDYTVKYANNVNPGTATITVTGKGNYGVKDVTITESFTITDPMEGEDTTDYAGSIKSVKASKDGYTYDGTAKYPKTLTIKTADGEITATLNSSEDGYDLPEGAKNVMIVVTNNINKGSGTVAVTGADKKTKKTTFPIKAADLKAASAEDLTITVDPAVYAVKGAIPAVEVSYKGLDLTEGADYTVKYKNNKAVGTATATITGKGNFAKSAAPVSFEVTPFEITKVDNVAVYAGVAGKGVKVTMYDAQGNVIPAKKNYTVKVEKGDTDITADKTKLQAGEEIKVTVTAAAGGNLEPDSSADIDITVAPNLAKIKVNVPKTFTKTFTGEAIELDEEDFESGKIAVGSLKYGEDFEIIGYQNNVKKGKMTVYIQGISENASGTGKFKVTIAPQTMKKAD